MRKLIHVIYGSLKPLSVFRPSLFRKDHLTAKTVSCFGILSLFLIFGFFLLSNQSHAAQHAVILLYHHVGDDTPPSTSVSAQQFAQHISYLKQQNFHVLPLSLLINKLKAGENLPQNSVAITFDDAYISLQQSALPLLVKAGFPFAIFANPAAIDNKQRSVMSWDELRGWQQLGGEILNHGLTHGHMLRKTDGESDGQWRKRIIDDVNEAQQRLELQLGSKLRIFAYPYGEFNAELQQLLSDLEFTALGQQSGAVGYYSSLTALPRYPIMSSYANQEDFSLRVHSRPLPVIEVHGPGHLLSASARTPKLRLKLAKGDFDILNLQCYYQNKPLTMTRHNENQYDFTIIAPQPLPAGRSKFTCTAPSKSNQNVYYWYSHPWIIPYENGSWPPD